MAKASSFLMRYILCMPYCLSSAFLVPHRPVIQRTPLFLPSIAAHPRTCASLLKATTLLSITLDKPLGLLLEEVVENTSNGVKIQNVSEGGSASMSPYRNRLVGSKLMKVMMEDVSSLTFDDVMDKLVNAPSPLVIEVEVTPEEDDVPVATADDESDIGASSLGIVFDVGTIVAVKVIQEGKDEITLDAKVGDNLRKTLLNNNIELYRGLKKKLGNCGGNGQCTFCAVDFVEGLGWEPRSEYEDKKIAKWPGARLACMNNIQGPCTVRIQ